MIGKLFEDENRSLTSLSPRWVLVLQILLTAVRIATRFKRYLQHTILEEKRQCSGTTGSRKFNEELCLDSLLKQSDQDSSLMQLDVDLRFRKERRNLKFAKVCCRKVIGQAKVVALKKKHPLMRLFPADGFQYTKVKQGSELELR